ncbi:putative MFS monocarboxylate transporter [Bombardia bombarda]|uniref:MFS monocarboxylate transporter n=1 Tax=Bombardia bombarda TaxID=252184 RepID=A0AA39XNU8_9PEZI|nr:putative MFS monocarboxylate transporter [Bombardia bombarda]
MAVQQNTEELIDVPISNMTNEPSNGRVTLHACLAVTGSSLALFCSVGFLNAFGVFQEYYKAHLLQNMSESDISWIGSVSIFLVYGLSPLAGILVDRIGPTTLLITGSLGELLAIFMTSLCTHYYQFFLAQAILLGVSMSFLLLPPMSVVTRHLPHHRGLALGIVIGGSSIGGVVWPVMLERLLNHTNLGFGWTMRIIGFTMIPLLAIACATVLEPASAFAAQTQPQQQTLASDPSSSETEHEADRQEKAKPKIADISILKNPAFTTLCLGLAISFLGLYIPFFYVSPYASARGINPELSFYLISIMNGASLFGRVVPGHLADRYGHFNTCIVALISSAAIGFCWTAATSFAGLVVWALVYGFSSGAIVSLQGACASRIATHRTQGTAMGLVMGASAITALVGNPVGGTLVGKYGYLANSMFTGATLVVGTVLIVVARLRLDRKVWVAV